ncbi:MAG TPA: hypothetical protein VM756_09935 [Burkholderiales bacterium]|nr:hypothetical protein [Burkholderiales bacterium]
MTRRLRLEHELRATLTDAEYRRLVKNLESALDAFTTLGEHSPHLLRSLWSDLGAVSTDSMSDRAQSVLRALADELRAVQRAQPPKPIPSRQALRLAYSGN